MDGLIELVFDDVPLHSVDALVGALTAGQSVLEATHSENSEVSSEVIMGGRYSDLLNSGTEAESLFLRFGSIRFGPVTIRRPLLRVLRYQKSYDVEVLFESGDIEPGGLARSGIVDQVWRCASRFAGDLDVSDCYCGIEPASDVRTRFFSRDALGPLEAF